VAIKPIFSSPQEAVADIPDGSVIMLGGFTAALGAPFYLFRALVETTQTKDLTFIGNGTPQVAALSPAGQRTFYSIDPARVRKVICSFPAATTTRRNAGVTFERGAWEDAFLKKTVELELVPQGTLAERLRAGGSGIPAFFTPTGVGTVFQEGKEVREFEGRQYVMERWLRADYALVHALRADKLGNLYYRNTARNFNPPMAAAARITIAEVEEIVEPGEIAPELIVTPGIFVDRLVLLREGSQGERSGAS